jgi:hypothetical protein
MAKKKLEKLPSLTKQAKNLVPASWAKKNPDLKGVSVWLEIGPIWIERHNEPDPGRPPELSARVSSTTAKVAFARFKDATKKDAKKAAKQDAKKAAKKAVEKDAKKSAKKSAKAPAKPSKKTAAKKSGKKV